MSEECHRAVTIRHTMTYGVSSQRSGDKYLPSICIRFSSVDYEASLAKEEFKGNFTVDIAQIWTSRIKGVSRARRYFCFRFANVGEGKDLFPLV